MSNLTLNTRVRYTGDRWAKNGTLGNIVRLDPFDPHMPFRVQFDGSAGQAGPLWVDSGDLEAVSPGTAKEPSAPMTKSVLDHLRRKGSITSMEAQGVLRCRQLPARILELKRLGHLILTEIKLDPTGQRYARYHFGAASGG